MLSTQFRYDPEANQLVNIATGARSAPAHAIAVVPHPPLQVHEVATPRTPRYRDTVTMEEYDTFIEESVRAYTPPPPPGVPDDPDGLTGSGKIQISLPATLPTGAEYFNILLRPPSGADVLAGSHLRPGSEYNIPLAPFGTPYEAIVICVAVGPGGATESPGTSFTIFV